MQRDTASRDYVLAARGLPNPESRSAGGVTPCIVKETVSIKYDTAKNGGKTGFVLVAVPP